MQPGKTTIHWRNGQTHNLPAPTVVVGADDRMLWVTFGTISILLSAPPGSEGRTIIVRGEAEDIRGNRLPLEMHAATDVRNQVEFHLQEAPATQD